MRLHPLAIGLSFAVGTVLTGILGAIVAVPVAAIIYQALPALRGQPLASDHLSGRRFGGWAHVVSGR